MPVPDVQRPILDSFRQRVAKNLTDSRHQRLQKSNIEAEREAWQAIENELIEVSYSQL
jgi:uncharacterized protein YueI